MAKDKAIYLTVDTQEEIKSKDKIWTVQTTSVGSAPQMIKFVSLIHGNCKCYKSYDNCLRETKALNKQNKIL